MKLIHFAAIGAAGVLFVALGVTFGPIIGDILTAIPSYSSTSRANVSQEPINLPKKGEIGIAPASDAFHPNWGTVLGGPGKLARDCRISTGSEVVVLEPKVPGLRENALVLIQTAQVSENSKNHCAAGDEVAIPWDWLPGARETKRLVDWARTRPK